MATNLYHLDEPTSIGELADRIAKIADLDVKIRGVDSLREEIVQALERLDPERGS